VTGKQERHDFVAHLLVIPLACLLILRQQEHREQITPLVSCSALSNDAVDYLVKRVG